MIFLTKKKYDEKLSAAVREAVMAVELDVQTLRHEIAALRADAAEAETERERDLVRRLTLERDTQNAGVQGLLEQVWAVRDRPDPVYPDLSPGIAEATKLAEQALDIATYALESPVPDPIVLPAPQPKVGEVLPHYPHGWVRPLGAS